MAMLYRTIMAVMAVLTVSQLEPSIYPAKIQIKFHAAALARASKATLFTLRWVMPPAREMAERIPGRKRLMAISRYPYFLYHYSALMIRSALKNR